MARLGRRKAISGIYAYAADSKFLNARVRRWRFRAFQSDLALASCLFVPKNGASDSMGEDRKSPPEGYTPANDNRPSSNEAGDEDIVPCQPSGRVDRVVLDIARLIGRRLAREQFEARLAANDNLPRTAHPAQAEVDED
ncbi:hypothetical protein ACMDCR_10285 [Labrys okinawensis]|uniref:hypothetical protein n=1 Tax=Labrys okinawensis TaxID=346911 RepID=UPI0039BC5168